MIGDVTDKGVPAAMVMAAARSVLRASGQRVVSPGEVLERVNDLLGPDIPEHMFVTCLYAVVDPSTGTSLRERGAQPAVRAHRRGDGGAARRDAARDDAGDDLRGEGGRVAPGESLLLYSDGITEAHDANREMYGTHRLGERVASTRATSSTASSRACSGSPVRGWSRRTTSRSSRSAARSPRAAGPPPPRVGLHVRSPWRAARQRARGDGPRCRGGRPARANRSVTGSRPPSRRPR